MKWRLLAIFLLLGAVSVQAQDILLLGVGGAPKGSGGAGYQGPGNIASGATAFWSCGRAYNAAYATAHSPACDVVDTATGLTTCTFNFLSTGFTNPAACNATACATACSVTKMYDQTGNGNHEIQATLANMPGLTTNAQNGLPCAAGASATGATFMETAGNIAQAAPFSMTIVTERTGSFTTLQRIMRSVGGATANFLFAASANTVGFANTTAVTLTANDSAFHAMLGVASATAPLFAVDSSANTSTTSSGTTALSGQFSLTGVTGANGLRNGFVCEAGLWPSDLNSSYQAMLANMRSSTNGWNF